MRSSRPKVLHEIGGLSLIGHVCKSLSQSGVDQLAVVIGPDHEASANAAVTVAPDAQIFVQGERKGTAHAVLAAGSAIERGWDDIVVVYGDTPFVRPETIDALRQVLAAGAAVVVAGMRPGRPEGYGRLIMDGSRLLAIREERDASPAERQVALCNGGIMALNGRDAPGILAAIGSDNSQGEYYLTDAVELANARGLDVRTLEIDAGEVFGINDRAQLAEAEARFQAARRRAALDAGVTLTAPETVYFSHDTALASDVTVEPNVVFAPGVTVAEGARIRAYSHLEGTTVGEGGIVGPFARLRPGATIAAQAKVGNFCEIKNADIGPGAKVNHLTYIGDASVGAGANIGAGTITCNYDGAAKHRTEIGQGAFIGSNSALVAPVTVGAGSYIASGSVITDDVAPDALSIARARQVDKPDWARRWRKIMKRR